ncbi:MAG: cytochrome-c oxidase, cbb3-type subunit III [Tropicimonas sp.]|uniref:cytochrome-c oxidase, cbb3-type subunit III n=1 Tax=Tropicimonas sp. TaxID=2067044 RepID=UPI003A83B2DA
MSDHGTREIDPVTGRDITSHDWNGIRELNTPLPKLVIWALIVTFAYSVLAWILLPAWPVGRDYTRGLLGLDQGDVAVAGYRDLASGRQGWLERFAADDFASLQSDTALMAVAGPAAQRLFEDNCAACHGLAGQGGPGFPALSDASWLWSGDPAEIALTIRHGINSEDPDTRIAEMPPFDWMERAERDALAAYVAALPTGAAAADDPAVGLFADNCASCHGDDGEGGLEVGAPSLADTSVVYGQDPQTVMATLRHGRIGEMPAWSGRLSAAEINLLALHVAGLGPRGEAAQ